MIKQCFTPRFGVEVQRDRESMTAMAEKLDIKSMLERAAAGILDLNTFERPQGYDFEGDGSERDAAQAAELLKKSASIFYNTFGASYEEAIAERDRSYKTAMENMKPKTPDARAGKQPAVNDQPHDLQAE